MVELRFLKTKGKYMNRRNFTLAGLTGLLGGGCAKKIIDNRTAINPVVEKRNREIEQIELEIAKTLGDKLASRNWKLAECQVNFFHGIPNTQGTKLHWWKSETNGKYIFFLNKYKESLTAISGKIWVEFGTDNDEKIYSKWYTLSDDEAAQVYLNLVYGLKTIEGK